jgi:hypothetical protein
MLGLEGLVWLFVIFALYFIPTMVARSRKHRNSSAITALNILLGWTVLGWIIAFIWALTTPGTMTAQAPGGGTYCASCGRALSTEAKFCPQCGAARAAS